MDGWAGELVWSGERSAAPYYHRNLPSGAESILGYDNGSLMVLSAAAASKTLARARTTIRRALIVAVVVFHSTIIVYGELLV